jgi:hypothetical protein
MFILWLEDLQTLHWALVQSAESIHTRSIKAGQRW